MDSVLLIAFGGPQGVQDIRPFLDNVLRGRRVSPQRVEEVARHYEQFGGISPIRAMTERQAAALCQRLTEKGVPLPVYVGMRNWHPYLADTLAQMSAEGRRDAIGFIAAPHGSYSSCGQYRQNVADARAAVRARGRADVTVTFVPSWHTHERFIEANAAHVRQAYARLPDHQRSRARLVFTAHSIPIAAADACRYREQLAESSGLVAARVGVDDWAVVYQSRSGRPEDPWLEPDVCDYLRSARAAGLEGAVLCPIGFVCDHIEVLYDLDREAAEVARGLGMALERAEAVNDDPIFIDMMADVVLGVVLRYATGRALPISRPRSGPPLDTEPRSEQTVSPSGSSSL